MPRSHLERVRQLTTALALAAGLLTALTSLAEDEKPEPLDKIGDAAWSDNVGLVRRTTDEKSEESEDRQLSEEEQQKIAAERAMVEAEVRSAVEAGAMAPAEADAILAELDARLGPAGGGGQPGDAPAAARMTVPHIAGSDVGYTVKVGGPLVAGDQIGGRDSGIDSTWGVVAGLRLRGENPRELTSLLVPWGHGTIWIGGYPDFEAMKIGGDVRLGLDIHPLRWPWLGVGAMVEYRLAKFLPFEGDDIEFFGHDIGFGGHVIFRTKESPGDPPLFFADAGIIERISMGNETENGGGRSAAYFNATLGIGGNYRFLVFLDAPMGGDHYQGVQVGVGGGGYY